MKFIINAVLGQGDTIILELPDSMKGLIDIIPGMMLDIDQLVMWTQMAERAKKLKAYDDLAKQQEQVEQAKQACGTYGNVIFGNFSRKR